MAGKAVSVKPAWRVKQCKNIRIIKLLVTPVQTGRPLLKKERINRSKQAFTSFCSCEALSLGILRCFAGALETVLLALFYSSVAGQQPS